MPNIIENIKIAKREKRLTYRFVVYVILCSSILTLLATSIQLYAGYSADLDSIESDFRFVQQSYVPAVSTSVYKVNIEQLKLQLNGILQLRDMVNVEVEEPRGEEVFTIFAGVPDADDTRKYPLKYKTLIGENVQLGTISVSQFQRGLRSSSEQDFARYSNKCNKDIFGILSDFVYFLFCIYSTYFENKQKHSKYKTRCFQKSNRA